MRTVEEFAKNCQITGMVGAFERSLRRWLQPGDGSQAPSSGGKLPGDAQLGAAGGNGELNFIQNPYYDSTPAASPTIARPLTIGAANGTLGSSLIGNTLTTSGATTGTGRLVVEFIRYCGSGRENADQGCGSQSRSGGSA